MLRVRKKFSLPHPLTMQHDIDPEQTLKRVRPVVLWLALLPHSNDVPSSLQE